MLEILEKLKNLDYSDVDSEDLDSLDEFENLNLNDLSVQDFEKLLGKKHLKSINELMINGVNESWLKTAELTDLNTKPWFTRYTPSTMILNEEPPEYVPVKEFDQSSIPDIKSLTKKVPSDFLWNNLIELSIIYSFIYTQFSSKELKNEVILKVEVIPILMEMCTTLIPSKSKTTFMSAVEAIESAKSVIFFNSTDHDMNEILSGVLDLLNNSKLLLIMISDMVKWFKLSKKKNSDEFFAGKKLEFMLSWLNSEVKESGKSVDEILKTLSNIISSSKIENNDCE